MSFFPVNCTPTSKCFYFSSSQTVKALNAGSQHSFIYSVTQSCRGSGVPAAHQSSAVCSSGDLKHSQHWSSNMRLKDAGVFRPSDQRRDLLSTDLSLGCIGISTDISCKLFFFAAGANAGYTSPSLCVFFCFVCLFFSCFIQPAVLR